MVNKIFDNKDNVVKGINDGLIDLRKRYNESGDYGYAEFDFSIIGDDVLDAACEEFPDLRDCISVDTWSGRPAKMKKLVSKAKITIAEFVHCYAFKYYISSRRSADNEIALIDSDRCYMQTIIRTKDGQLLCPYFYSAPSDLKAGFFFYNDHRNYAKYQSYYFKYHVTEPSRTAALTDKKLQQWIDYLNARAKDCDDYKSTRENVVSTEIQRLIDEIDPNKCDTYNVNEPNELGNANGKIVANNIRLSYDISDGVMRFELEIDRKYPADYIELFKQMTGTAKK